MCSIHDCEPAALYHQHMPTARKQHVCSECHRTIAVSEKHQKATMLYEGYWDKFRTCLHCLTATEWLNKECGGYLFTQVLEEIEEHAAEYRQARFGLLKLKIGMRRQWRRFDGDGLMDVQPLPVSPSELIRLENQRAAFLLALANVAALRAQDKETTGG